MSIFKHKLFDLIAVPFVVPFVVSFVVSFVVGFVIGAYIRRREDARVLEMAHSMTSPICPYADLNEAMKTGAAARAA